MLICPKCLAKRDDHSVTLKELLEIMQHPKKINNCTECDGLGYKTSGQELEADNAL